MRKTACQGTNRFHPSPKSIALCFDSRQSSRRLNYDLQVLCDHVRFHSIAKVILAFQDSETFDGALLNDIVGVIRWESLLRFSPVIADCLSSWQDRIPFVCLFSIKTSVELFQEKLHPATIQCLHGAQFRVTQIDLDSVFETLASSKLEKRVWLGPGIVRSIMQTQQDSIQSIASFTRSLQVCESIVWKQQPSTDRY